VQNKLSPKELKNVGIKYAIVTPVKDEINYFTKTTKSIIEQEILPQKWIIINDGSTDGTEKIIEQIEIKYGWIEGIHREPNTNRKPGGEFVLGIGLNKLNLDEYDFIVRMDGDLEFEPSYFKQLFEIFDASPELGIAGGVCYITRKDKIIEEKHPRFHTRGPLKTYRTKCFKDIGGLEACLGWDTIDELKANMLGWKTRSFPELKISHLKKTQSAQGFLKAGITHGKANYYAGYSPFFIIIKTFYWLARRRYKTPAFGLVWGYFSLMIRLEKRPIDKKLIKYVRKQQRNKIFGKDTIWK